MIKPHFCDLKEPFPRAQTRALETPFKFRVTFFTVCVKMAQHTKLMCTMLCCATHLTAINASAHYNCPEKKKHTKTKLNANALLHAYLCLV